MLAVDMETKKTLRWLGGFLVGAGVPFVAPYLEASLEGRRVDPSDLRLTLAASVAGIGVLFIVASFLKVGWIRVPPRAKRLMRPIRTAPGAAAEWVDKRIEYRGVAKVLLVAALISIFLGTVSWASGTTLLTSGVRSAILFLMTAIGIIVVRLQRLEARLRGTRQTLIGLRDYVDQLQVADAVIVLWREQINVSVDGDATFERRLTYRVQGGTPIHYVVTLAGGEQLNDDAKNRMRFEVREESGGGRLRHDYEWESARRVRVWVYLPTPLRPGAPPITLIIKWTWPKTLAKLAKRDQEQFSWRSVWPVERLEYRIVLEKQFRRTSPLRFVTHELPAPSSQEVSPAGSWIVEGTIPGLTKDRRVALTLDAAD